MLGMTSGCIISQLKFRGCWRSYQQRVLDELEYHFDDKKLNVVAAPGAGKTTLGIEVILRLKQPAFILAPTITIKNQWKQRFLDNFLPPDFNSALISTDIKNISEITVSTYQGLGNFKNVRFELTKTQSGTKKEPSKKALNLNGGNDEAVLDLLHAHRVSPKLLRNRRLNLFAIRICSLCSLHPSANPPNSLFTLLATIVTKLKSGRKTYRFLIRERRGSNSRPHA